MSDQETILIVNENDEVVGSAPRKQAQQQGLWHRIVCVYIVNSKGEIYIQKRGSQVDLYPNVWDHSSAGHVDSGEDVVIAAKRELFEELGIKAKKLTQIAYYKRQSQYKDRVLNRYWYLYEYRYDGPIKLQKSEISEGKFVSPTWLKKDIKDYPDKYTGGCKETFRNYLIYHNL
ncbi:NUDIX domain-containing protein [Candidatus Beckwithbacteria bacterium]|nr:NUDIX domain-containing protein [Candidatus Beckwithbacteria bacterium]